ncbi:unnamed protein product, partial [Brassica oleracea var. botrytis]
ASQNAAIDGAVAFHRNKRGLTRFWCRPLLQFMTLSASCLTRRNGNNESGRGFKQLHYQLPQTQHIKLLLKHLL